MKNATTMALSLFAVTLALSSVPIRAEVVSNADQTVALNTPEIKVVGKGVKRKGIVGKYIEYKFVLRSSPIESVANMRIYRDYKNYDVLTCKTPCLFKIPGQPSFTFNVETPIGYILISKTPFTNWGTKNLIFAKLVQADVTFSFAPQ